MCYQKIPLEVIRYYELLGLLLLYTAILLCFALYVVWRVHIFITEGLPGMQELTDKLVLLFYEDEKELFMTFFASFIRANRGSN